MLGHNNGPPLDEAVEEGGYLKLQAWRKAREAATRPPSPEVALRRARAAERLGLTYHDYSAILWDRGRAPNAFFFDLGGTLVRTRNNEIYTDRRGDVVLMPGVREKLSLLREPSVYIVTDEASLAEGSADRHAVENYIDQVDSRCGGVVTDHFICDRTDSAAHALRKPSPAMVLDLLAKHKQTPGQSVMIGDAIEDELCALRAGLARFFWGWFYFATPPAPA